MSCVLNLLDDHYSAFMIGESYSELTQHPIPCDSRAWSQILISSLTGIKGYSKRKGPDLEDGSDVKSANCWGSIDSPRFNNVIPSGRVSQKYQKPNNISSLDSIPYTFFVLWDYIDKCQRCRVWFVRPQVDVLYRKMCEVWYSQKELGLIKSSNFQLHPSSYCNDNILRNKFGSYKYPLLYSAIRLDRYYQEYYDSDILNIGLCEQ